MRTSFLFANPLPLPQITENFLEHNNLQCLLSMTLRSSVNDVGGSIISCRRHEDTLFHQHQLNKSETEELFLEALKELKIKDSWISNRSEV